MRLFYLVAGLGCVAIGGVGVIVPGLPTTVFFIMAAWCFSRSSERLEKWVLDLPGIGPMVRDHRAGLGMPRRAKVAAGVCIVAAVSLSAGLAIESIPVRLAVLGAGVAGLWYIGYRVPTRETVLSQRQAEPPTSTLPTSTLPPSTQSDCP